MTARVLLVEDDALERAELAAQLGVTDRLEVTEADSLAGALSLLARERYELVLLDRRLPGGWTPDEVIAQVAAAARQARVLVYSEDRAPLLALESVQAGAARHLVRGQDGPEALDLATEAAQLVLAARRDRVDVLARLDALQAEVAQLQRGAGPMVVVVRAANWYQGLSWQAQVALIAAPLVLAAALAAGWPAVLAVVSRLSG